MDYNIEELLKKCATEEIHLLGDIQDYACLIAIDSDFIVNVISENFDVWDVKLGQNISEHFTDSQKTAIQDFLGESSGSKIKNLNLGKDKAQKFYCYKTNNLLVMELELADSEDDILENEDKLNSITRINDYDYSADSKVKLAEDLAKTVKNVTSYDRVMVYRFHPDDHGEVIAEEKEEHLESFLNLHYPESDIPKQARALFIRNQVRLISDVDGPRVKLLSLTDDRLDLSDSICRHSAVVHLEYLRNMGVVASLTIALVVDGKLWGLIACHNYSPKFIDLASRSLLRLIGYSFSSTLSKLRNQLYNRRLKKVSSLASSVMDRVYKRQDFEDKHFLENLFESQGTKLMALMRASGVFLEIGKRKASFGTVPSSVVIREIEQKLIDSGSENIFVSDHLRGDLQNSEDLSKDTAGVMAVGFVANEFRCQIMWFRKETIDEITWAGKDDKSIVYDKGHPRLSPRGSFEEVTSVRKERSISFSEQDSDVAFEFFWYMNNILLNQLKFAEKNIRSLEKEASEKDLFISNLSHELRTPINNILGWHQLYKEQLELNPDLREFSEVVANNSKQQLMLVNDLLDMSKVSTGKIELKLKEVDLRKSLSDVVRYFQPSLNTKNIQANLLIGEGDLMISADATRLQQILRNVLQNAIKFTPRRGEIWVYCEKVDSDIEIRIKDSGVGFKKDQIEKIFKPFYQIDQTSSKANTGLGLGLALVKNLVDLHGGQIQIYSEGPSLGAEVTLKFPVISYRISPETDRQMNSTPVANLSGALKGYRIMLVEDTVESARFVKMFLEKQGAEILWFSSAPEALKDMQLLSKVDLVISDIGLPEIDGYEFVKLAKSIDTYQNVPFIAFSAYGTTSAMEKSIRAGFVKHIVKPLNLTELLQVVQECL